MKRRIVVIIAVIVAVPIFVVVFYEGRKSYWDMQVKEMCDKDGGVKVFEAVTMTAEEFKRLGGDESGLPIPFADDQRKKDFPYFFETSQTRIRDWNPEVARVEMEIKRRTDGKVLGRSVHYFRRGGDTPIPMGLFDDSSYMCPKQTQFSKDVFRVQGALK